MKHLLTLLAISFAMLLFDASMLCAQAVRNDFLLNDDTSGEMLLRDPAQVARNQSGAYVVTWLDNRNGEIDIYAQVFDASGTPVGSNLRVNQEAGEIEQWDPDVAIDDAGNFVVAWGQRTPNSPDVFAQRFAADGSLLGPTFQVNDDGMPNVHNNWPAVAMDPSTGDFVIAFNDNRDGGDHIWAQRYASDGSLLGINFRVNTAGNTEFGLVPPAIGMDANGNTVIAWADNRRSGVAGVWAQRYDASGNPIGSNFVANDTSGIFGGTPAKRPEMAVSRNGAFIIGWVDGREGFTDPEIYAQRFDNMGMAVGGNFLVNDDIGANDQEAVSVAIADNGAFAISWHDDRNDFFGDVFVQRYDASGTALGANFLADDNNGLGIQEEPALAMNGAGKFVVVWNNDVGADDVMAARFDAAGAREASPSGITDEGAATVQAAPAVDMNANGRMVAVWQDEREVAVFGDIYAQILDEGGNEVGGNIKVNDDTQLGHRQYWPDVAIADNGSFVVTWYDARQGNWPIVYAQRFAANGTPIDTNFVVSTGSGAIGEVAIEMDGAGNFIIVWEDDRDDDDIYAQAYDASGNPLGGNFRLNTAVNPNQYQPAIAMNHSGDWVVAWRGDPGGITAQRYDASGTPLGGNFRVSERVGLRDVAYSPSIAMDDSGAFTIAWHDGRNHNSNFENLDIYAQSYDKTGAPIGMNFRVNDDSTLYDQESPSIAMDPAGSRFLIVWTDWRETDRDPELLGQLFENGVPVDSNRLISQGDFFSYHHQHSRSRSIVANSDNIFYAWEDNRRHKHWDIYGKMSDWGLSVDIGPLPPARKLSIFPNPAREKVWINLPVSVAQGVEWQIYDAAGRLQLSGERHRHAGQELLEISLTKLPDGLYFVKINAAGQLYGGKVIVGQ